MAEHRTSIDIEASPERVFDFLVTDAGMTSWMGQWASLDPVPGGLFAVDIAGYPARGMFLEVDPPRRVTVSWGFVGSETVPPGASTVSFELAPISTGTRVEVVHTDLPRPTSPARSGMDPLPAPPHPSGRWRAAPTRHLDTHAQHRLLEGVRMTNATSDALSTVQAYHQAWTGGDVDRALTYVADDVLCFAPDENVTTKDDWRAYLTAFVPMLTGAPSTPV